LPNEVVLNIIKRFETPEVGSETDKTTGNPNKSSKLEHSLRGNSGTPSQRSDPKGYIFQEWLLPPHFFWYPKREDLI
jgi:hypothetical protein